MQYRRRFSEAVEAQSLRLGAIALAVSFIAPSSRGLPIGDRQLAQFIPSALRDGLTVATTGLLLALLVACAAIVILNPQRVLRSPPFFAAIALLATAVAFGAARGILGDSTTKHALSHGQFVLAYVIALGLPLAPRVEWERLFMAMRIGYTIPAGYSLLTLALNGGQQQVWYTRILPDGTSFGAIACFLWIAHARETRDWRFYLLAATGATGVLVSGTRAWVAAFLVSLLVYGLMTVDWRSQVRPRFAAQILAGAAAVFFASTQMNSTRFMVDRTLRDVTLLSDRRVEQAKTLWAEWLDSPFIGSGLGHRNPALARPGLEFIAPRPYLVEMSYLNLLAKLGLIGFSLLAAGIGIILWQLCATATRSSHSLPSALVASVSYLLLTSVANPTFESLHVHVFVALAIVIVQVLAARDSDTAGATMPDSGHSLTGVARTAKPIRIGELDVPRVFDD